MDPIQAQVPNQIQNQQVAQPTQQEDSFFDRFLKGLVEFIWKLVTPQKSNVQQIPQTQISQPTTVTNSSIQQNTIPNPVNNLDPFALLGKIGWTLENIGNQTEKLIENWITQIIPPQISNPQPQQPISQPQQVIDIPQQNISQISNSQPQQPISQPQVQ